MNLFNTFFFLFLTLLWMNPGVQAVGAPLVEHVIMISFDGLHPDAITNQSLTPSFYEMKTEGASTNNARTDYDFTDTLTNHVDMVTGVPTYGTTTIPSHDFDKPDASKKDQVTVPSVFSLLEQQPQPLTTAFYYTKKKLRLFPQSWPIYYAEFEDGDTKVMPEFLNDVSTHFFNFTFLHLRDLDSYGHVYGWLSTEYNSAVVNADRFLNDIFGMIEDDPTSDLYGTTAIIVTSDHGGGCDSATSTCAPDDIKDHDDPTNSEHYTIPFYVWGPGVAANSDLYDLDPASARLDPGTGRPDYNVAPQPIRHADAANLIADFFGLSFDTFFNKNQDLCVMDSGCTNTPHSTVSLEMFPLQNRDCDESSSLPLTCHTDYSRHYDNGSDHNDAWRNYDYHYLLHWILQCS